MLRLIQCILLAAALAKCFGTEAHATSPERIRQERQLLESKFVELCGKEFSFLQRNPHQSLLFLADQRFDAQGNTEHARLARLLAQKFRSLANSALEADDPTLAYELLHEAMFFGDPLAETVVASESTEPRVVLASNSHSKLRWKRKTYFQIFTEHFHVVTKEEQEGIELAKRLERLRSAWGQIFFECWSNKTRLKSSLKRERSLTPRSIERKRHRVVLFPSRAEYIAYLQDTQARIEITLGFYDLGSNTSYFFSGPDSSPATQFHEVTHQLFQEAQRTSKRLMFAKNFWVIEGVAMYMESLSVSEPIATVGGLHSHRLQFARYRRLQEDFYVPLDQLVSMGRFKLQRDERIRQIYSQSAGLSHFFMDGEANRYRKGFIDYLKKIYMGRDHAHSLFATLDATKSELDLAYAAFLDVNDSQIMATQIPAESVTALCLGKTSVTTNGLEQLPKFPHLDWLDLTNTNIGDRGLAFIEQSESIRQLSLEGTQITDAALPILVNNLGLEELDLSNTNVTDEAAGDLANLRSLKVLWLSNTAITDVTLQRLSSLPKLEFLAVDGTRVTPSQCSELRKKLPNLTIRPDG